MKVYVAAHCRWAACHVAQVLEACGFDVISTWHEIEFLPTESHTEQERQDIAFTDAEEVAASDAVVLVSGKEKYSGGKFVEAGIALGLRLPVIVIGRRENMLLWHPLVSQVDDPSEVEGVLK